jgi:hypothetical protein
VLHKRIQLERLLVLHKKILPERLLVLCKRLQQERLLVHHTRTQLERLLVLHKKILLEKLPAHHKSPQPGWQVMKLLLYLVSCLLNLSEQHSLWQALKHWHLSLLVLWDQPLVHHSLTKERQQEDHHRN